MITKTALILAAFAALGAASALPAHAGNFPVFATGVDASGMSLPNDTQGDLHYTLVSTPSGAPGTVSVLTSAHGSYPAGPGGWVGDSATSAWIVPNNGESSPGMGYYDYQTTFDLSGFDPATASLIGQWATDNVGTGISLNGQSTGNTALGNDANNHYASFTINSGFQPGVNTLDFFVLDDGQGATGLRVDGISGNANPVPEVSSTVSLGLLLTLGLGGAFLARRKAIKA